jgi:hypothetical protein
LKKLKIEDIKNLPNVPSKTYEIKEWGFSIEIQGISKAKQIELGRIVEANETDAFDYQKELLKACIVEPELSDKDIDELYKKDSAIIDNIFLEINTLNGIGGSANAEQFQD